MLPSFNLTENSIWITDQQVVVVEANICKGSLQLQEVKGRKKASNKTLIQNRILSIGVLISIV